jgi:DNA repair exonuclease SbcCD nuclease subunit
MEKRKPMMLVLNDIHINKNNSEKIMDLAQEVVEFSKAVDCEKIVMNGDIFTERQSQQLECLKTFKGFLNIMKENGLKVFALPGNHDKVNQQKPDSYLDVYDGRYMTLFDGVGKTYVDMGKGFRVHLLPFFEKEEYLELFERAKKHLGDGLNVCLTHIGIHGVLNNDEEEVVSSIKSAMFKECFDLTVIGHYHNYNKVTDGVFYTGSCYPANYGENNRKGITVVYEDASFEVFKTSFQEYFLFEFDKYDEKEIEKVVDENQDKIKNHNVRFKFYLEEKEVPLVDKKWISSLGVDLKIEVADVVVDEEGAGKAANVQNITKNLRASFVRYAKNQELPPKMVSKGLKMIKECGHH